MSAEIDILLNFVVPEIRYCGENLREIKFLLEKLAAATSSNPLTPKGVVKDEQGSKVSNAE